VKDPRCPVIEDGKQCVREQHPESWDHLFRQEAVDPDLNNKLKILELALDDKVDHVWAWAWTYMKPGWMVWLVENGYLTEEHHSTFYEGLYMGFSWSGSAPYNRITEKGRALVAQHAMVEW
jgi:hypothetical protein